MTNIQAAIGCAQVQRIDEILDLKKGVFEYYKNNLSKSVVFLKKLKNSTPSYWMVPILFASINDKNRVEQELKKNNIETRPFFTPIDLLPYYKESECLVAKNVYQKGLLLPSFPLLNQDELNSICTIINNTL